MNVEKVFDLSVTVPDDDVTWVLAPRVKLKRRRIIGPDDPVNSEDLTTPVHFGTHIDAPFHMIADGKTIDQYPADAFIGPGKFLDFSHKKPMEAVTANELKTHDLRKGDIVLFYFNWFRFRGVNDNYLYNYPGLGVEAAKYLTEISVKGVGTDAFNIEQVGRENIKGPFPGHIVLNKRDIWIIEGLADLKPVLGRKDLWVAAFPIKLKGVGGSPARVVALEFA